LAIAVTLSSCLITQPTHFDEPPNSPPVISAVTPPLQHIVDVDITSMPAGADAGPATPSTLDFEVTVYDRDVDQRLQVQVLLDGFVCPSCVDGSFLDPSASMTARDRRTLRFHVPTMLFGTTPDCHSVQLLVSGQFKPGLQEPIEDGDLATTVWWILADEALTPHGVELGMCP
jgi:hypothetical protein